MNAASASRLLCPRLKSRQHLSWPLYVVRFSFDNRNVNSAFRSSYLLYHSKQLPMYTYNVCSSPPDILDMFVRCADHVQAASGEEPSITAQYLMETVVECASLGTQLSFSDTKGHSDGCVLLDVVCLPDGSLCTGWFHHCALSEDLANTCCSALLGVWRTTPSHLWLVSQEGAQGSYRHTWKVRVGSAMLQQRAETVSTSVLEDMISSAVKDALYSLSCHLPSDACSVLSAALQVGAKSKNPEWIQADVASTLFSIAQIHNSWRACDTWVRLALSARMHSTVNELDFFQMAAQLYSCTAVTQGTKETGQDSLGVNDNQWYPPPLVKTTTSTCALLQCVTKYLFDDVTSPLDQTTVAAQIISQLAIIELRLLAEEDILVAGGTAGTTSIDSNYQKQSETGSMDFDILQMALGGQSVQEHTFMPATTALQHTSKAQLGDWNPQCFPAPSAGVDAGGYYADVLKACDILCAAMGVSAPNDEVAVGAGGFVQSVIKVRHCVRVFLLRRYILGTAGQPADSTTLLRSVPFLIATTGSVKYSSKALYLIHFIQSEVVGCQASDRCSADRQGSLWVMRDSRVRSMSSLYPQFSPCVLHCNIAPVMKKWHSVSAATPSSCESVQMEGIVNDTLSTHVVRFSVPHDAFLGMCEHAEKLMREASCIQLWAVVEAGVCTHITPFARFPQEQLLL